MRSEVRGESPPLSLSLFSLSLRVVCLCLTSLTKISLPSHPHQSNTGDGTVDWEQRFVALEQRVSDVELQYTVDAAELSANVSLISITMSNLMAKNDSVSYDMHIAAFQAMMTDLGAMQTQADANANRVTQLVASHTWKTDVLNATIADLKRHLNNTDEAIAANDADQTMQLHATTTNVTRQLESLNADSLLLNQSVATIQTTMDLLMTKNDSVSYDMHVAAFDTMLKKLAGTNDLVQAHEAAAEVLTSTIQSDYAALKDAVETLQVNTTEIVSTMQDHAAAAAAARATLVATLAATTAVADGERKAIAATQGDFAAAQDNLASAQDVLRKSVTSNAALVAAEVLEIDAGVTAHGKEFAVLNGTVYTLMAAVANNTQTGDGEDDPTLAEQLQLISENMKQYGLYTQCSVGGWSAFGACSHTCDGGTMSRTRSVAPLAGYEGIKDACPVDTETATCNTGPCPKDCAVGNFSDWSECSAQCGPGTQVHTRPLLQSALGGGSCPKLFETQACQIVASNDTVGCTAAVLAVLEGTWAPDDAANSAYKVCTGGEIDTVEKLAPFNDCELISGNLKFFIPVDFTVGSTFAKLIAVSGDVVVYNTGMKQLAATSFPLLAAIGGSLQVAHNTELLVIESFGALHAIRGLLDINNNAKLLSVELLEVQDVEGRVQLSVNAQLEIVSYPKLKAAGEVWLENNNQLSVLALSMLAECDGQFYVKNNNMLYELTTPELVRISKDLQVLNNQRLDHIVMPKLALAGYINIYQDYQLDFVSFPKLVVIEGNCHFQYNDALEFVSMPELTRVDGKMYIYYNHKMVTFSMPKLMEIDGDMQIDNNRLLESLADFSALTSINGGLYVQNNPQMQCIKGLSNVSSINGALSITQNTKLFMCDELYSQLSSVASSVNSGNSYVKRDDCDHACGSVELRQDCELGGYGGWTNCSDSCGPATHFRSLIIVTPASNGGSCDTKEESAACDKSRFNTPCDDTVSKILAGSWDLAEDGAGSLKVCDGGEVDDATQLAAYTGCEIINGNLKFFLAEDVDFIAVQPFSALLAVSGDVVFFGTEITEIPAGVFPSVQVVGGKLLIGHNTVLVSVKAFRQLHTVGNDMRVEQNEKLAVFDVDSVEAVGGDLEFSFNRVLKAVSFSKLKVVDRTWKIEECAVQTVAMPLLESVGGEFFLVSNNNLKSTSLPKLTLVDCAESTDSYMYISHNNNMQTLDLSELTTVNTRSNLQFLYNNALNSINLPKLTFIKSNFEVLYAARLTVIAMPALKEIGGSVQISSNPSLTSMKDFDSLAKVNGQVNIRDNVKLQCIRGWANVAQITGQVCISGNSKLFMCDELANGLKTAANNNVCSSFSYVPRDNCDHVCV